MRLKNCFQKEIEAYRAVHPCGPTNLFEFSIDGLIKLGYKRLSAADQFQDGDVLVANDKDQNLFILIDDAAHLKKSLKKKEISSPTLIVYRL